MRKAVIVLLALIIVLSNLVYAQQYISAEFQIQENGFVEINGEADINPGISGIDFSGGKISGTTQALTEKKGGKWTFTLDIAQEYEAISLNIIFPENTKAIENIETGLDYNINLERKMVIEILDSEKPVEISVDYKIGESSETDWLFSLILILIILSLIAYIVLKKKKQLKKMDVISPLLNENEEKIVRLLEKKPMRQKEIRKILEIPKASFSRYMYNLEKKKIILREGEGKNKLVRLK